MRSGDAAAGRQGLDVFAGISAESAGARALCQHLVRIPPGARAQAHLHRGHETAIYVLSGRAEMRFGPRLEEQLSVAAGDFLYIPADLPHLPWNPSDTEPCVAIVARTDPHEQESVELYEAAAG
ncbi:MAG TPA: cupin domain-containing protein [Gaiellaceae bacterium]